MGILKDIIQAITSTESDFCNILSQSNYEFSNFRNEIIKLGKKASRNGYNDLFFIQLNILDTKNKSTEEYDSSISLYYKMGNGKTVKKFEHKYTIFGFSNMPNLLTNILKEKGELKINFEDEYIHEFFDNKDLAINTARIPLNILIRDELKVEKGIKTNSISAIIKDDTLYYKIQLFYDEGNEKKYIKEFLTSSLTSIENEKIIEALEKEGIAEFSVSQT